MRHCPRAGDLWASFGNAMSRHNEDLRDLASVAFFYVAAWVFYASFCTRHSRSVQSHLLTYTPTVPTGAFAQKSSGTMVPIFGAIMCNTKTLYHFVLCFYTLSSCVDAVSMCIILNHCIQKLYSKSSGQHTTLHPKWALFQACALLVESLDTVIVYVTDWYCPAYIF